MLETEEKITEDKLKEMSEIYQIELKVLHEALPVAEQMLYKRLKDSIDLHCQIEE
jgi:hypothetical protein